MRTEPRTETGEQLGPRRQYRSHPAPGHRRLQASRAQHATVNDDALPSIAVVRGASDTGMLPARAGRSALLASADSVACALTRTISLLHATYRAGEAALEVRAQWLGRASDPGRIEHVFALDADDEISVEATKGLNRVVNPPLPGTVTAVRNWNAAADASGRATACS